MSSPGPTAVGPPPDPGLLSLYDRALPEVYGYLLARCGQRALAEDLTAETFLAAVRAEVDGRGPTTVAWLIGTARHKLVDHWRRREREERGLRLLDGGLESRTATEDPWDAELDVLRAAEVLDRLTPAHRAALMLRYLDDLPVPQVAELLGRTLHATEALLVRARIAFRGQYESTEQPGGAS
jgi:RNA polymerase sigma-70 factor (ECF subfamily)